ncbi:hypothetical protein PanWU01x14_165920 [Parasponia andersonii]|uniref:Uncharacterized protein n=1 Tax=Parasponia andersonii TaxID=3476 RepID=A0A2P5CC04_PARAD|nr:hypothetical protein PanWU01x14_165920 [Parasponia andersonii]
MVHGGRIAGICRMELRTGGRSSGLDLMPAVGFEKSKRESEKVGLRDLGKEEN